IHKPLRYAGFRTRVNQPGRVIYNNRLWSILQTGSQRTRVRRTLGPRFVRFAALFYGSLAVVAAVWCGLRGFDVRLIGESLGASALLGGITATCTVFLGLLAYRFLPTLREISEELAPRLVDGAASTSLVLVAIFSGVGEEAFFRGALQQEFGLVVASVLFGLAHIGPDRRYLVWTAWAVLAGFVFGYLYETSGGLLAPLSPTVGTTPRRSCSGNAPVRTRKKPVGPEQAPQHHHGQERRPLPCRTITGSGLLRCLVARCDRIRLAGGLLAGGGVDLTRGQGHRGEPGGQGVPDLGQAAFRRGARGGLRLPEGRGLRHLRKPRGESRADVEGLRPWPSTRRRGRTSGVE